MSRLDAHPGDPTDFASRSRHIVKRMRPAAAALCLATLVAGCGLGSAAPKPTAVPPTPRPKGRVVPPALHAYAVVADSVFKQTQSNATKLRNVMSNPDYSTLAATCLSYGGIFSADKITMHGLYTPHAALPVYYAANVGYQSLMTSTDECAMAADGKNAGELATAINDLDHGYSQVSRAYALTAKWRRA
jgi:hypothetical protein